MTTMQTAIDSINHYIAKGIPKDAAIAIISCLWYESKLNPGSQGVQSTEHGGVLNPYGAYGIPSLNGPRQASLRDFAAKKGENPGDLNTQLDFVLTECANSYHAVWAAITSQSHYSQIIPIFVAQYENPADHQKEINAAMSFAAEIYSNPGITSYQPPTTTTPAPIPTPVYPTPTPTPTMVPIVNPAVITSIITIIADIVAIIKQLSPVLAALHTPAPTAMPHAAPTPAPAAATPLVLPSDPALATAIQQILAAVTALSPPQGAK